MRHRMSLLAVLLCAFVVLPLVLPLGGALAATAGGLQLAGEEDDPDPPEEEEEEEDDEAGDDEETSGTAVMGRLSFEGEPVQGVEIVALRDDEAVASATSDEDGEWRLELPGAGRYTVELNQETLPDDVGLTDEEGASTEVRVLEGRERNILFPLGEREDTALRLLRQAPQVLLNGIKLGLIIGMAAIGLSLIYGTTRLINFAHGEFVALGAIIALVLNTGRVAGLNLFLAGAVSILLTAAVGGALDRGMFRPLRARKLGLFQLLVITIGLSLFIRHLLLLYFGGRTRRYGQYVVQERMHLGPLAITPRDLVIVLLSLLILIGVGLLLQKTRIGKAMRAVADNVDLAESSGIDVQRVILIVWILGGGLAAAGGIFLGATEGVNYLMGFRLLLLMFAGVILGGIGTAYGALVGSLVVGLVTEVSTLFFPPELKVMWALLILILVLLVRPTGILGTRERIG